MSIKTIRLITWSFISALLIAAYILAKPHEPKTKSKTAPDRLQWSAKAKQFILMPPSPGTTTIRTPSPTDELRVPIGSLDAVFQISLSFRPVGGSDSSVMNPIGSGTLTIQGQKFKFVVDPTSRLTEHTLSDGITYVEGPLHILVDGFSGKQPVMMGVSALLETGEGYWSYPYTTGEGMIMFGEPFASPEHAKEITDIQSNKGK